MNKDKLIIKVSQKINSVMNSIDKELRDKHGTDKEFYGILISKKDNPWVCEDVVIPKQKVTGASIIVPKEGMYAPYQKHFEEAITLDKEYRVVGTIHSHNSMNCFFSGGDDEDLDNNSCFNLNEGLPFIDIVWSNKDNSYKARARIKWGKGESKQIFTHDNCECVISPDSYTKTIIQKVKDMVDENYNLDEDVLTRVLVPVIKTEEMINNIEVDNSYSYSGSRSNLSGYITPTALKDSRGGNIKVNIGDYNEIDKEFPIKCEGDSLQVEDFLDLVKEMLGVWYDMKSFQYKETEVIYELRCKSKNRYKKIKYRIMDLYYKFQDAWRKEKTQQILPGYREYEDYCEGYTDYEKMNGGMDYVM